MSARRAALVVGVLVLAAAAGGGGWTLGHDHPRVVELVRTVERTRTITRTVYRTRPAPKRSAPNSTLITPAASPSFTGGCADACGQNEPVIFTAGSYSGTEPSSIDFSADGGNIPYGLVWSSWPSGPNGVVPATATAAATGTVGINNCVPDCATGTVTPEPVTITLSDPIIGSPTIWGQITELINGQPPQQVAGSPTGVYTYPGTWPFGAS